jgi:hypothetical protein
MAHFVDQNEYGKPEPEFHSKHCPVKSKEGRKTQKKLQLEDCA